MAESELAARFADSKEKERNLMEAGAGSDSVLLCPFAYPLPSFLTPLPFLYTPSHLPLPCTMHGMSEW